MVYVLNLTGLRVESKIFLENIIVLVKLHAVEMMKERILFLILILVALRVVMLQQIVSMHLERVKLTMKLLSFLWIIVMMVLIMTVMIW